MVTQMGTEMLTWSSFGVCWEEVKVTQAEKVHPRTLSLVSTDA